MTHSAHPHNARRVWSAIAALAAGLTVGCGDSIELVPVHGKVLFRGEPLSYGSVMFQPEGDGPLARGVIQSDGTFVAGTLSEDDGVRPGTSRVRVTSYRAQQGGANLSTTRELALGPSAIPEKYSSFGASGVTVDVSRDMQLPLVIELE